MGLFRREPVHKKLAREAGLDLEGRPAPHDTSPRWGEVGIHGVARQREWDAVAMLDVPGLEGRQHEFVELPGGTLLVDDEADEESLGLLADALDVEPPYRARAVRREGETWAVGARRIEVVELPAGTRGDEITLSVAEGEHTLVVDGLPTFGGMPELERLGASRGESYVVHARRLDDDLWEVQVTPL